MTTELRPSLDDARQRVEWAQRSLETLRELERAFSAAELSAASVRIYPEPNVPFEFGRPDNPIPPDIPRLSSETIGHLRSALDYLVYQLAWLDSGQVQEMTQFPVETKAETFWGRRRQTYLKGVSDEHVRVIAGMQPFSGCSWTKALQSLSNPDKHRRIVSAIHNTGIDAEMEAIAGHEPGQTNLKMKFNVVIYIAFDDGSHVISVLDGLVREVGSVLATFHDAFEGD